MSGSVRGMGRLFCLIGLHHWVYYNPLKNIVACGRRGCRATKEALRTKS